MKILILDDHILFTKGLRQIIEKNFYPIEIFTFNSIASLREDEAELHQIDLFISDIELPNENIFELLYDVKQMRPMLPVLVLSMHNKLSIIKRCIELKVSGYVLKDDGRLIIDAITEIMKGGEYFSKKVKNTLKILETKESFLTPLEKDIIKLFANGCTNDEIAKKLFISFQTVLTYRKTINSKLKIQNPTQLINYYKRVYE